STPVRYTTARAAAIVRGQRVHRRLCERRRRLEHPRPRAAGARAGARSVARAGDAGLRPVAELGHVRARPAGGRRLGGGGGPPGGREPDDLGVAADGDPRLCRAVPPRALPQVPRARPPRRVRARVAGHRPLRRPPGLAPGGARPVRRSPAPLDADPGPGRAVAPGAAVAPGVRVPGDVLPLHGAAGGSPLRAAGGAARRGLHAAGRAWTRFFHDPQPVEGLALFRILLGAVLLLDWALLAPDTLVWLGEGGVLSEATARRLRGGAGLDVFTVLPAGDAWVVAVVAAAAAGATGLLLGYRTRWSAALAFVGLVSVHHRNPLILNSGDALLRALTFLLIWSPAGDALSL